MITLEPGSEVHRRRMKDRNLIVDRERDRLCPTRDEGRNLRRAMQRAASSLTASSGGSHSGKMYLTLYTAKESETMATVQGLMIMDST